MHLKVFLKLKTPKNPKNPLGWVKKKKKKNRFFPTLPGGGQVHVGQAQVVGQGQPLPLLQHILVILA